MKVTNDQQSHDIDIVRRNGTGIRLSDLNVVSDSNENSNETKEPEIGIL